jgi:hypothetical protein
MKKFVTALMFASGVTLSAASGAAVINGNIGNVDGDGDGAANDLKISRVMFNVTAGTSVFFDSLVWEATGVDLNGDGKITGFDNYMTLFNGTTMLQDNDDSYATFGDGSVHPYDSTISHTFDSAGTYLITIGQLYYDTSSALRGYQSDRAFFPYSGNENFGAWRLTMAATNGILSNVHEVGVNDVPEPASIALLSLGLLGAGAARRKSKKQSTLETLGR